MLGMTMLLGYPSGGAVSYHCYRKLTYAAVTMQARLVLARSWFLTWTTTFLSQSINTNNGIGPVGHPALLLCRLLVHSRCGTALAVILRQLL